MILLLCWYIVVPAIGIPKYAWNNSMAYWMTELPRQLKEIPIIYLAIPGSHGSMTYGITQDSDFAPDIEEVMSGINPLPRTSEDIFQWTKTQDIDVKRQLEIGIRYFDLRLATKNETESLYFTRGAYGDTIAKPFDDIMEFLEKHPKEVVIFDFNYFSNFDSSAHNRLWSYLLNKFGGKMWPVEGNPGSLTLANLQLLMHQVIIIYRTEHPTPWFWHDLDIPTSRQPQSNVSDLLVNLASVVRTSDKGFVDEVVLKPSTDHMLECRACYSRRSLAKTVQDEVLYQIQNMNPGQPPIGRINIVTADFVDMNENRFPQSIVQLNFRLLSNKTKIIMLIKEL